MGLLGIVVIGETKSVTGLEPAVVSAAPFLGFAKLDHSFRSFVMPSINAIGAESLNTMFLG
jgi:hypothetical protein